MIDKTDVIFSIILLVVIAIIKFVNVVYHGFYTEYENLQNKYENLQNKYARLQNKYDELEIKWKNENEEEIDDARYRF